jgi:hypothetical protein
MFGSDLKPLDILNFLLKYADDCTLLCPELSSTSVEVEMAHITEWARLNKMLINLLKTKEMVFHRPCLSHDLLPGLLPDLERVTCARLLGVLLTSDLKFTDHVSAVVSVCNQRLYLISQLKKQGLWVTARDAVFASIIVNRLMYALPVFYGHLTEKDKLQITSVFAKAQRWRLISTNFNFDDMACTTDYNLFQKSLDSSHCLNHLYTPKVRAPDAMELRKRGHDFVLPNIKYDFNRSSFTARALYDYR